MCYNRDMPGDSTLPFREPLSPDTVGKGFESDVSRFERDPRFVIKRVSEESTHRAPELEKLPIAEYARRRFAAAYRTLAHALGSAVPESTVLVAQQSEGATPDIVIAQRRVHGETLEQLYGEFRHTSGTVSSRITEALKYLGGSQTLDHARITDTLERWGAGSLMERIREVDDLIYRSLCLWEESLDWTPEQSPLALSWDQTIRYKAVGEGLFPELSNRKNIMVGTLKDGDEPHAYYIDNGLILVPPSILFGAAPNEHVSFIEQVFDILPTNALSQYVADGSFCRSYRIGPDACRTLAEYFAVTSRAKFRELQQRFATKKRET